MFQQFLQVAALNTVIAFGITMFGNYELLTNLVYSHCIGMSIWAFISLGQKWLMPQPELHRMRLLAIVPVSVVLAYLLGTALASSMFATYSVNHWTERPREAWGFLFVSLLAGGISTYFFMSREQLARAKTQIEAVQRQATEAQLKLLQAQLEPHMLFNTLANLRALITLDPIQAQHMLDSMVAYLRATLNSSRATQHPLQDEFNRLRDYLELMAVRMGPRLHYILELPPELTALAVPPLLLQPLVENAIKHGLEPKVQGGAITVRASQLNRKITIDVVDTGVGLSSGKTSAEGFGLTQVRERLATIYGTQASIKLIAGDACGVCARVTFPC